MSEKKFDALLLENQLCFPLYACSREVIKLYRPYLDELERGGNAYRQAGGYNQGMSMGRYCASLCLFNMCLNMCCRMRCCC